MIDVAILVVLILILIAFVSLHIKIDYWQKKLSYRILNDKWAEYEDET